MAISIDKYVNVITAITGGQTVQARKPWARYFTNNMLCPVGSVLEFYSLESVMNWFGVTSKEYAIAVDNFGWVSKRGKSAKGISFARYYTENSPSYVLSGVNVKFDLDDFKAVEAGTLSLKVDGVETTASSINLSSASDLSNVASIIKTAFSSVQSGIEVEYSTEYNGGKFILSCANSVISACTGSLADLLGLSEAAGAIVSLPDDPSPGTSIKSLATQVSDAMSISNNCYSFAFIDSIADDQHKQVAEWNALQNSMYTYVAYASTTSAVNSLQQALGGIEGVWIQYDTTTENQYDMFMTALGANLPYTSINYMYQQFPGKTAVVTDDATSDALDSVNINYYGSTQQSGQIINFLQRGKLQGSWSDASIYTDSIWLKDQVVVNCLQLFLLNDAINDDPVGRAKISGACSGIWADAISRGVISVGGTLSESEKAAVEALTGDEDAWQEIVSQGFIFKTGVQVKDSGEKYFTFRLIYKASDKIRSVEGDLIAVSSTAQ